MVRFGCSAALGLSVRLWWRQHCAPPSQCWLNRKQSGCTFPVATTGPQAITGAAGFRGDGAVVYARFCRRAFHRKTSRRFCLLSSLLYLGPPRMKDLVLFSARAFLSLAFCGLSFSPASQIAFALVGISLWIGFCGAAWSVSYRALALGCLIRRFACVALDSWFYGQLYFFTAALLCCQPDRASRGGVGRRAVVVVHSSSGAVDVRSSVCRRWWCCSRCVGRPGVATIRWCFWVVPFLLGHAAIGHKASCVFCSCSPFRSCIWRCGASIRCRRAKAGPFCRAWAVPVAVGNLILFGLRMLIPLSSEVRLAHSVWDVADLRGPNDGSGPLRRRLMSGLVCRCTSTVIPPCTAKSQRTWLLWPVGFRRRPHRPRMSCCQRGMPSP